MDRCFHLCYYDHHHNSVDPMFKQGAEEALPQLRILLQIRRVGFYIKCKYFLIFMIYLAFSKFGQLRIGAKR
jgi:choline-glycine betaine transporter